jgi:hypothetical protein
LAIAGKAKSAGGDGENFLGMEKEDFTLEAGKESESTKAGGRPDFSSEGDALAEAYEIGFFVMETEGRTGLFGEEKFKGVRTEIEDSGAEGRVGHKEVKADC